MNKDEILNELVKLTNVNRDECETILKAFEKESEIRLENKIRGNKKEELTFDVLVARRAELSEEKTRIVVKQLEKLLNDTLSKKLTFQ